MITVNNLSTDPEISSKVNVTAYPGRSVDNLTYDSYDLSNHDVIVLEALIASVVDTVTPTVLEARNNGAYVIAIGNSTAAYNLHNVDLQDPQYSNISEYFQYPSSANFKQLLLLLGVKFCNCTADVQPPVSRPLYGIYHPDATEIYSNLTDYLNWYSTTSQYNPSNPTVGIVTGSKYTDMSRDSPLIDALIRSFESKNVNVVAATYTSTNPNIGFFMKDGVSFVDALVVIARGATLNSKTSLQV
ncbi:cobaltochelatase subunit CobN [Methanobacterium petrolearium]|uniref:cobaltochelatase subunit CobN n=1 Tax=Methanobacterium petrolearium TaxID=710190 RepID=UPI003082052A|nr:hypothetical protein GCM10025861_14320 [Methanobacterium petrolearium]